MKYVLRVTANTRDFAINSFATRDHYRDLLSICEGLLADKEINPSEAAYLKKWMDRHAKYRNEWPFPDLLGRLNAIFADGIASPQECSELADILTALIGGGIVHNDPRKVGAGLTAPTQLIFEDPAPDLIFPDREFCVTGIFAFGQRGTVEKAIKSRGGMTVKAPRTTSHYVVVGSFVSPGWANGNFGTKIERALSLRKNGAPIAIIGEEHWKDFLK